jgi:hypothetical protein
MEQGLMMRRVFCAATVIAIGTTLSASGGKINGGGATGTELTMRIPDESAPAGAMVQMKVLTTEVTPISGGRPGFGYDAAVFGGAAGFGIMAPNGEAAGAAIIDGSRVQITYSGTSLLTANYPILTVVMSVRPDAIAGSKTAFGFDRTSVWEFDQSGPVTARISPAAVTVAAAGSTTISDVVPGEGVWPGGTVVSVRGTGFDAKTSLKVNDTLIGGVRLVSPTEMQFVLVQPTEIRGLRITATGKNSVTYYAYMRGLTAQVSSRTLLAKIEPIFSTTQRTVATIAPALSMSGSQYEAVALQNPNLTDVTVGLSLHAADGTVLYETSRTMSARERLALEASELLDGVAPPAGATIVVTASQPIDAFSLLCDEATATAIPVLPLEAQ